MKQNLQRAALLLAALLLFGCAGCVLTGGPAPTPSAAPPVTATPAPPSAAPEPEVRTPAPEPSPAADAAAILSKLGVSFLGEKIPVLACNLDVFGYQGVRGEVVENEESLVTLERLTDFVPEFQTPPDSWELTFLDREGHPLDLETESSQAVRLLLAVRYATAVLEGEVRYSAAVALCEAPALRLSNASAPQGGALIATLTGGAGYVNYSVYLPHLDRWIALCGYGGERIALLPVGMVCDPGVQTVELYRTGSVEEPSEDPANWEKVGETRFTVTRTDYERQELVTSEETQSLYTSSNNNHDSEKLRLARAHLTDRAYFSGNFALPLEGRRTTEFGMQRYVNGKLQSRHTGYDIGAPAGSEIRAPETGVVTMAEELIVYGNTVVLDHGLGVYTSYSHMSELWVDEGDWVEKGAVIGLVGSTGYSTGPHLHYTLLINGYYADPAVASVLFEQ